MPASTGNSEPLARFICERDFRRAGMPESTLAADVDRCWHSVAAQIEAGFIDDDNELVRQDFETSLAAYSDWRARHPAYTPPFPVRRPEKRNEE
jgi:hypothetical protein